MLLEISSVALKNDSFADEGDFEMRGDVLELKDKGLQDHKRFKLFLEMNISKMVLIRELDEEKYLVAFCCEEPKGAWVAFDTSAGKLYVNIRNFESVEKKFVRKSHTTFANPSSVVNEIYRLRNLWKEELKVKRKLKTKEKREVARCERNLRRDGSFANKKIYEKSEVADSLQWAARHPFQGGGFSGK